MKKYRISTFNGKSLDQGLKNVLIINFVRFDFDQERSHRNASSVEIYPCSCNLQTMLLFQLEHHLIAFVACRNALHLQEGEQRSYRIFWRRPFHHPWKQTRINGDKVNGELVTLKFQLALDTFSHLQFFSKYGSSWHRKTAPS